ncbi:hypothetical protein TRVA0_041S01068 [Trichomonascus vanleenenianus]|uniref:YjbQ family protein n=1 Tax=Trichomonascus vanleenenianus TaxID=2268995 RepID=UPI003ECB8662
MSWNQVTFKLQPRTKGVYLVTDEIYSNVPQLKNYEKGMLNLFIKHTSAGLSINENYDPDVRTDMSNALDRIVPEDADYLHTDEGPDDSTSHIKSSLVGSSLNIPISNGRLALGTWQGIYLCEFRNARHTRSIVATINGQTK